MFLWDWQSRGTSTVLIVRACLERAERWDSDRVFEQNSERWHEDGGEMIDMTGQWPCSVNRYVTICIYDM